MLPHRTSRSPTPSPPVYWLDDPARPARLPRLTGPEAARPAWSSAAATPGCGRPCAPRSGTPHGDVVLLEARPLRRPGQRPQRRVRIGEPHPRLRQRRGPLARGDGDARPAGSGEPRGIGDAVAPPRHRLRAGRAPASCTVATAPHQVDELAESRRVAAGGRTRRATARPGPDPVRAEVELPTYLGRPLEPRRAPPWSSRPGWPGGCAAPAWTLGVRVYEGTEVTSVDREAAGLPAANAAR